MAPKLISESATSAHPACSNFQKKQQSDRTAVLLHEFKHSTAINKQKYCALPVANLKI